MTDEPEYEDVADQKLRDRTAGEIYLSRCEHKFYMRIVYIMLGYVIFSVVCFVFWQIVGGAVFTVYAKSSAMSAYDYGWSGFSIFVLVVWIIGSIIWAIKGGITYSKGPSYDQD